MNREVAIAASVMLSGLVTSALWAQSGSAVRTISVQDARELIAKDTNVVILDVRTPAEYHGETGHLANAILIPIQELDQRTEELTPYKGNTILAYCRTGNRSGRAAALLSKKGFAVLNMEGGIVKWNEEHFPVVRSQGR